MSVAALQAMALRESLRTAPPAQLAKAFFAAAAKVIDIPWSIAVGNDLKMPETVGPRTAQVRFINWYIARLHKAARVDTVLSLAFHRAANLLAPPTSLMKPGIAWRVLTASIAAALELNERRVERRTGAHVRQSL